MLLEASFLSKPEEAAALDVQFLGKPGQFNLSRVEKFGRTPELIPDRADGGTVPVPPGFVAVEWLRPGEVFVNFDPFDMEWMWAGQMARFMAVENAYPTWVSPGLPTRIPTTAEVDAPQQISIRYSNTFIARPELFRPGAVPDLKLIAPVRPGDVAQTVAQQQRLLDALWPLLAPGGRLLYATCSLLKAENEAQIARFLGAHADAREQPLAMAAGEARPQGRQLLPQDNGHDGFYYALLEKTSAE